MTSLIRSLLTFAQITQTPGVTTPGEPGMKC